MVPMRLMGLAPWIVCLLLFRRLVGRAGMSIAGAALLAPLVGTAILYTLYVTLALPQAGIPVARAWNPGNWPGRVRKSFLIQVLAMLLAGVILLLADLYTS